MSQRDSDTTIDCDPEPDPRVRAGCLAVAPEIPWHISGTALRAMDWMDRMSLVVRMNNVRSQVRAVLNAADKETEVVNHDGR